MKTRRERKETMAKVIGKRFLSLIPVLFVITLMAFTLMHAASSDAASILLRKEGVEPTEEAIALKRVELGLDKPLPVQYINWIKGVAHLDFGTSYQSGNPVLKEIVEIFPNTLKLTLLSFGLLLLLTIPVGILSALYPNTWIDYTGRLFSFISVSMPSFWIGMLLLYFFAVRLKWIPVISNGNMSQAFLPALTLTMGFVGSYVRHIRSNVQEIMSEGYIKAAKAKGMKEGAIVTRHIIKNAMVPMITRYGMSFCSMLGGAAIVEAIFSWPGLGGYVLDAIQCRDIPVVQGYVLFLACIVVVMNLLVDILYAVIDPRIKI